MVRLLERMDNGIYPVGSQLPTEPALSAEFEVSRTVIREALSRLKAHQRIRTRHGIGSFVTLPSRSESGPAPESGARLTLLDVLAMQEARTGLEVEAAAMAAQRRNDRELLAIEAAMREIRAAMKDPRMDITTADIEFHLAIAAATGNDYIREMQHRLSSLSIPCIRQHLDRSRSHSSQAFLAQAVAEHQLVLDAIRNRDDAAARKYMRQHMKNAEQRTLLLRTELEPPSN